MKKNKDNLETGKLTGKLTGKVVRNLIKSLEKLEPKGSYPEWVLLTKDQYKQLKKIAKKNKSLLAS